MFRLFTHEQARRYSQWIVYGGSGILLAVLLRLRQERVANENVAFFSGQFLVLLAGTIVLMGVGLAMVRSAQVYAWLERIRPVQRVLVAAGIGGSGFALAGITTRMLPFMQTYIGPYVLWLLLIALGVGLLALSGKDGQAAAPGNESAEARAAHSQRRSDALRIVRSVVIISIITVAFLEIGLRVWFTSFGSENDQVMYVYSWDEIRGKAWLFRGLPYVNYGLSPTYAGNNSLGYRGPEVTIPKPDGIYRIVALGGSTTYGDQIKDWSETYPAQLQQILREEYGYPQVEVVNAGVPSYTSWEILVNFQFRVLDLQPDLIVFYEGINDLSARVHEPEHYRGLSPAAGLWLTSPPSLSPSVLYRFLAINLGWATAPNNLNFAFEPQYSECCAFLPDDVAAERIAANPPIYYERNLRNLVTLAASNGVDVLMSTWTYFPDSTGKPGFNSMTRPYRQAAVAEHNAIVEQVARDANILFYDLITNFPHNRDFWSGDGVHMTTVGTQEQAAEYAAFLAEQQLIPAQNQQDEANTGRRNGT